MTLKESFNRCFTNRTIAGATAKISAKLLVQLTRGAEVLAIIALEHRNDEARCAIATLRAVALNHLVLHRMEALLPGVLRRAPLSFNHITDPFDGSDLPSRQQTQRNKAAINRPISG